MGCIYVIENTVNGKKYVGQSTRLGHRKYCHFNDLKKGTHYNDHLQRAFNKYGESAFTFKILVDNLPEHYMDDVERGLIATLKTMNFEYGYNKESGGNLNKRQSEETKRKIGAANKGKRHTDAAKQKMSKSHLLGYAKGRIHPMSGKKGIHNSPKTEFKTGLIPHNKGMKMPVDWVNPATRQIIDSEGVLWPSLKSFCLVYGGNTPNLIRAIKNNRPYKGIYLRYYDELKEEAQVANG